MKRTEKSLFAILNGYKVELSRAKKTTDPEKLRHLGLVREFKEIEQK